jgi:hypothetical protein
MTDCRFGVDVVDIPLPALARMDVSFAILRLVAFRLILSHAAIVTFKIALVSRGRFAGSFMCLACLFSVTAPSDVTVIFSHFRLFFV